MTSIIGICLKVIYSELQWHLSGANELIRLGWVLLAAAQQELTHWGRVTHKCVSKLTIIGSDNGLSPGRRQAIIWTNAGILLIGPLVTNFSEILIEIYTFLFKKINLKVSSGKWRLSCLSLNVLNKMLVNHVSYIFYLIEWLKIHGNWECHWVSDGRRWWMCWRLWINAGGIFIAWGEACLGCILMANGSYWKKEKNCNIETGRQEPVYI